MLATDSLAHIGRIAERHPGLRLTIDHLGGRGGTTTLKDDAAMEHMPELIKLARHPNVAVKATGAPGYCSGPYPFRSMHPYLRQIYDAFGPARMFWGTDITKMPCSWRQCVTMFTEELPWLSERDKELVMGRAVCAWWGWTRRVDLARARRARRRISPRPPARARPRDDSWRSDRVRSRATPAPRPGTARSRAGSADGSSSRSAATPGWRPRPAARWAASARE